MNNVIIHGTRLSAILFLLATGIMLSLNAKAQEPKSLALLETEVKEALNCSFITTDGVPDSEAYHVLDFILQDSKTFNFRHPYLRKIVIANADRGEYISNSGYFTEIQLPNTRDMPFLDYSLKHEIGHVIDHVTDARGSKEWKAVRKHIDTKSISTYAGKNDEELFAEMIAYRASQEYGKTLAPFPGDIEKMINKYLFN
ncbi:MAG: hypothetical protein HKK67_14385 [Chlorobiaceae bacterium]|nr:hypothetical protein [Chlorobiaceae bacterium]